MLPPSTWFDVNEVCGCIGQLFVERANRPTIRRVIAQNQFAEIRELLESLLDYYGPGTARNLPAFDVVAVPPRPRRSSATANKKKSSKKNPKKKPPPKK